MAKRKERLGYNYRNMKGEECTVIEYRNCHHVVIFNRSTKTNTLCRWCDLYNRRKADIYSADLDIKRELQRRKEREEREKAEGEQKEREHLEAKAKEFKEAINEEVEREEAERAKQAQNEELRQDYDETESGCVKPLAGIALAVVVILGIIIYCTSF